MAISTISTCPKFKSWKNIKKLLKSLTSIPSGGPIVLSASLPLGTIPSLDDFRHKVLMACSINDVSWLLHFSFMLCFLIFVMVLIFSVRISVFYLLIVATTCIARFSSSPCFFHNQISHVFCIYLF